MKRISRHKWDYQSREQKQLIAMARLGLSSKEIARELGFSDSQINYALNKAKGLAEMDQGFRVRWRCGNDPLLPRIMHDYAKIMALETERTISVKIEHLTPKVQGQQH